MLRVLPLTVALLLALLLVGGCASYEVDALVGYARAEADAPRDAQALLDDEGGVRVAGNFSRSLVTPGFVRGKGGTSLRANVNLAGQRFERDLGGIAVGSPAATAASGEATLETISPQIGPSFRVALDRFYVEPGLTGGLIYGDLQADYTVAGSGTPVRGDDQDISWAYRPYVRVGYASDLFVIALEGGYEATGLDFDVGPGDNGEGWYAGVVVGLRLTR